MDFVGLCWTLLDFAGLCWFFRFAFALCFCFFVLKKEPLPAELLDPLIKSKRANIGILTARQLVFGTLDQLMHTSAECDTAALFAKCSKEVWGVAPQAGTNMVASFGHLMGGYDSAYYG